MSDMPAELVWLVIAALFLIAAGAAWCLEKVEKQ